MMGEHSDLDKDYKHFCQGRFSWSAVFAGTLVAIGLSFLFQLFGLSLGLAAFKDKEGITALAITGFIGLFIATFITMFIAGFVSGRLGRVYGWFSRYRGALYGFVTWCLSLVVMIIFTSHVNLFVGSSYNAMVNRNPELAKAENTAVATASTAKSTETASNKNAQAGNTEEKVTKVLSLSFFLLFILFLFGAVSSILGGFLGHKPMHCDWKDKDGRPMV